jgi:hypothetical protein
MPFVMTNKGIHYLLNNAVTASTDIRALVCSAVGTPTDAQIEDLDFVAGLGAIGLVEVTNGGYTRAQLDLAGVTIFEDDTNNWTRISATAPTVANVVAGDVWKRIVYFVFITSDALSPVLGIDTPASTVTPNGGNITLPALEIRVSDTSV